MWFEPLSTAHAVSEGFDWTAGFVRFEVMPDVCLEGMMASPQGVPFTARVILIPDADTTPEDLFGITDALPAEQQLGARLVEAGAVVFIPDLINRDDALSRHPSARITNLPHREYVYRLCFEMGRHIVGLEVNKLRTAIDYMEQNYADLQTIVWGVGEGGLLGLMTSAIDERVDVTVVTGYFQSREQVWREPIYRNIWDQLSEFGDAELAGMIAPRRLIIDTQPAPEVAGPPAARDGYNPAAPGRIANPSEDSVLIEWERVAAIFESRDAAENVVLATESAQLTAALNEWSSADFEMADVPRIRSMTRGRIQSIAVRQQRQLAELVRFSQILLHSSDKVRDQLWSGGDRTSVDTWLATSQQYRDLVHDELIGRLAVPDCPLNPRSRLVIDEPTHVGYEVVLDVYPAPADAVSEPIPEGETTGIANGRNDLDHTYGDDWGVIAGGILLIPRDLQPGERRPVVRLSAWSRRDADGDDHD